MVILGLYIFFFWGYEEKIPSYHFDINNSRQIPTTPCLSSHIRLELDSEIFNIKVPGRRDNLKKEGCCEGY